MPKTYIIDAGEMKSHARFATKCQCFNDAPKGYYNILEIFRNCQLSYQNEWKKRHVC